MTQSTSSSAPMTVTGPIIGCFVSLFPAASHTFIRREVDALRRAGMHVNTYSIRKPPTSELSADRDKREAATTWSILPASPQAIIGAHIRAILSSPQRYVSTLRHAMNHRVPGLRAFLWSLFHFIEAIMLAQRLKADRVERLHSHFGNAGGTIGMLAAQFMEIPWSLTLHGISETDYPAGVLLPGKIAAADFVACVSWFGRAQAMRITPPHHWSKLKIVRCGIEMNSLPPKAKANPAQNSLSVICVGRLSPEKGQIGLIEAIARLRSDGQDLRLILVGDGPDKAVVDAAIERAGLGDAVRMTGRLDEAATLAEIAAADILVLPSFMEGLPVVLMEAMAIGVPVISSRVAGIPELVGNGQGLLFAPGHWDELTERLACLASDPALRTKFVSAARTKVEQEFDIDRAVRPLLAKFAPQHATSDL